jgi:hypothetical protein
MWSAEDLFELWTKLCFSPAQTQINRNKHVIIIINSEYYYYFGFNIFAFTQINSLIYLKADSAAITLIIFVDRTTLISRIRFKIVHFATVDK